MRRSLFIAAFVAGVVGGCYLRTRAAPRLPLRLRRRRRLPGPRLRRQGDLAGRRQPSSSRAATPSEVHGQPRSRRQPTARAAAPVSASTPAGFLTYQQDCPTTEGFAFCFNGACASLCGTDDYTNYKGYESNDDFCTDPQVCLSIKAAEGTDPDIDPEVLGGVNTNNLADGAGVCGQRCDAKGALPCPGGQYCTGALCLPGCDNPEATPCDDGEVCIALAGYSSCLVTCDPNKPGSCGAGNVCVTGLNICQPTCVGEGAIECSDGFACDPDLEICLPISFDTDGGSSSSTT
jgi:hypothetical protein